MKARFVGTNVGTCATLTQPGDVALGAENYHFCLMVNCPVCHELLVVDIVGSTHPTPRWVFDKATLTLTGNGGSSSVMVNGGTDHSCHWNLTNGEFIIHADSTAKPR